MRRTKIVCTLGPSSSTTDVIRALIESGMNVARLNLSHGTKETHTALFQRVRQTATELNKNVAILMDLQGPKIRTGKLKNHAPVILSEGARVVITTEDREGDASCISTTYPALPYDVRVGDRILLADGLLELQVEQVEPPHTVCRVIHGGVLGENKGINLPGVKVSAPCLTEKDLEDLEFALDLGADYIALSFVRHPNDLEQLRTIIRGKNKTTSIVAKIERPEAIDHLDEIIHLSDAIMVARGDLGVELPLCEVPQVQKEIIQKCNRYGVPVITATQMLESMMEQPRPTRAEATDVANAVYDGTDAVMLSGETAYGKFPIEAVKMMACILEHADQATTKRELPSEWITASPDVEYSYSYAIAHAVRALSETLSIQRIVCFTSSGYTARRVAQFRPSVPITAFTLTEEAKRRCALYWGVEAVQCAEIYSLDRMISIIDEYLQRNMLAALGETVVIVAGTPLAVAGRTNLLKLHKVGDPA